MKKKSLLLTVLATLGLTAATMAQNVPTYVPTNGLVGWFPFNGNANDESGNGNNGIVNGPIPGIDRFGNQNSAYSFDGVDDRITIPNSQNFILYRNTWAAGNFTLNDSAFTISVWVKALGTNTQSIFSKRDYTDAYARVTINGGIENHVKLDPNEIFNNYNQNILNTWTNVIMVYKEPYLKSYVNSTLIDSVYNSQITTLANPEFSEIGYFDSNDPALPSHYPFNGLIDDIGFWNRALTECELQNLYSSQLNSTFVSAGNDQSICIGDQVTLTATGSQNYSWNNGVVDGISFSPTNTLDYIVNANNAGCQSADTITIFVNQPTNSTLNETVLDSYTLNGQTYTQSGTYTQIIPNTSGCDSTITLNLTLSFTGIDEPENSIILISPNPSSDYFMVSASEELIGKSYSIIDLNGKTLKEGTLTQKEQKIEIGNLSEGMYMFKINNETEQTFRIVKN
jgi:hypothetical protein